MAPISLSEHLATQQGAQGPHARGVATVVGRLGRVAAVIAKELAHAALRDRLGYVGGVNVTGDEVKKLDVWGHEVVEAALRATGACAAFISEEAKEPIEMTAEGANPLVVCCDPVDGSSNLDVNGSVGTIFSLRPSRGQVPAGPAALGPGTDQVAAGYVMYGPATTLVYTVGAGDARVHARARDRRVPPDPSRHQDQAPRKDLRHQRGQSPHVAPGAARLRRVLAHARQGKWPSVFTSLLRRHGGRRPPNPARRRDLHVPRRLHRSRQAQAEAPAPLRGRADGHARRAGGRAREHGHASGCWTCRATEYHQRAAIIIGSPDDVAQAEDFYRRQA